MGFGYLLIGYLVAFVLKLLASALHVGFLALFVGYGAMLWGLWNLKHYCRSFSLAGWTLCPLLVIAVYRTLESLSNDFLWNLPFVGGTVGTVMNWAEFLLIMVFHAFLLSAIRELAMQVELSRTSSAAIRNMIIVLLYGAVYIVCQLPIPALDGVRSYFSLSLILLNIAWVVLNLALLLSCAKNICAEGQEDLPPKRYRWKFLNRVGDTFDRNMQKAADRSRADVEDFLRKKKEKREKRAEEDALRRKKNRRKK